MDKRNTILKGVCLVNILDENSFGFWSKIVSRSFDVSFVRVDEERHWKFLTESLRDRKVGLYVHFPFCRSFCLYCPFYREIWNERGFERYASALTREIKLLSMKLEGKNFEIVDAHVGGGSPSLVDPSFWKGIVEELRSRLNLKVDIGIEANPEDLVDESKVFAMAEAGISEISIGGQSFCRNHLKALGRRHGPEEVEVAINNCKAAGFKLINLDLMFMVPNIQGGEQLKSWEEDLKKAVQLGPCQITVYPTLITRYCKGYKLVEAGKVNQPTNLFGLFLKRAKEMLENEGYRRVRIYSWSRGGEYATVNLEMVGPLLCLGPGASGFAGAYEWCQVHSVAEYVKSINDDKSPAAVSRIVGLEERAARLMADQLFCGGEACEESFKALLGKGFDAIPKGMSRGLMLMRLLGWVKHQKDKIKLTERGFVPAHRFIWAFVLKVPCRMCEQLTKTPWPQKIKVP